MQDVLFPYANIADNSVVYVLYT